ncbi:MAG: acetyltransferase, partial [Rickettsiales bacterium]|nr:acetyltransferase [Rickettsiales bacterium]
VWIGQNVTILPGAKIGDGVIIGANSTVGGAVSPYSVVIGNPARVIKKRLDDELINLMLELKWWDLPIERIKELIPLLSDSNLDRVKKELKSLKNE